MIVFRPNVHAYMPGADIVNRPVVAAAAGSWWLSGGIDPGDVVAAWDATAGSKAASLLDLSGNGNNLTENGTVTWSSGNWSGFSTSNYFSTGLTPQTDAPDGFTPPTDGWSAIVQFTGGTSSSNHAVLGCYDSGFSARWFIKSVHNSGGNRYGYGNTSYIGSATAAGVMALTVDGAYLDGSLLSALTVGSFDNGSAVAAFIGCYSNNGTPAEAFPGQIQRVAFYSIAIDAYVADLSTAMAAL